MNRVLYLMVILSLLCVASWGCVSRPPTGQGDQLADIQKRGVVRIGVKYDAPPFGFMDADGKLKGMEIDLAQALAKDLVGKSDAVRFVQVNSSTRVAALNARQVDFVLATMTITPERAQVVNFTRPYYHAAQAVMVTTTSPVQHVADLAHKRVAYVIGATSEANLKKTLPEATLVGFKSTTEAFSAFLAGRTDAFSTDDAILYGFLHEYCGVRLLSERLSQEPYGIAFRKEPESQKLQAKVQAALDAWAADHFLEKLKTRWHHSAAPSHCGQQTAF